MQNLKRWIAALLALSLLVLCGCTEQPADLTTDPTGATAPTEPSNPTDPTQPEISFRPANPLPLDLSKKTLYPMTISSFEVTKTLLPENLDNPEGLPVLKWVILGSCKTEEMLYFVPFDEDMEWSDQAALEINAMLSQLEQPFQIQFVIFSPPRPQEMDWFRVPEVWKEVRSADLVTGPMDPRDMVTHLMPLTENVQGSGEPDLSGTVAHEYAWLQTTVEGEIYAIPSSANNAFCNSWWVRDEVFTELGLHIEEFQQADTDALLAALYAKNGKQPFLGDINNGRASSWYQGVKTIGPSEMYYAISNRYQMIGSCFAIDYSGEKPVVVNYLETEYVRKLQEKMLFYSVEGYYGTQDTNKKLTCSNSFSDVPYSYQETAFTDGEAETVWLIPMEPLHYEVRTGTTYATGICKNSGKQELAMMLLEKLGSDEAFRGVLCYGIEGKDYVVQNGTYQPLERKDGSYRMDFLSGLARFAEFEVDNNYVNYPQKEGMTRLETYRESLDNADIWLPAEFNWVYMEHAVEEINAVLETYLPSFPLVSEKTYDKVLKKLREAGSEEIVAELQRQLDYWLEQHPEYADMLHK